MIRLSDAEIVTVARPEAGIDAQWGAEDIP